MKSINKKIANVQSHIAFISKPEKLDDVTTNRKIYVLTQFVERLNNHFLENLIDEEEQKEFIRVAFVRLNREVLQTSLFKSTCIMTNVIEMQKFNGLREAVEFLYNEFYPEMI